VLTRQLELAGFKTANHGQECLEMLADGSGIDIILMDIEMPVMDGISAAEQIRQLEAEGKFNRIPIIAVTGNARGQYIEQS
jgi:CheY-like chemotaxis protein